MFGRLHQRELSLGQQNTGPASGRQDIQAVICSTLFEWPGALWCIIIQLLGNLYISMLGLGILMQYNYYDLATRYVLLNAITLTWDNIFHIRLYVIC